jgi:hypothetical protein
VSATFGHNFTYIPNNYAWQVSNNDRRRIYALDLVKENETKRYFVKVVWNLVQGWSEAMIPLALNEYFFFFRKEEFFLPFNH